jgi:endonuclease/exonuclease/phosphatase family metal-dependent hydrolase
VVFPYGCRAPARWEEMERMVVVDGLETNEGSNWPIMVVHLRWWSTARQDG